MSTFLSRIQDYVGTYADTTALDDWLTACAKKIVDIIPAHKVDIYSTEGTDSGTGLDIEAMRFIRAHKSGYGARVVSPSMKSRYLDADSIYYATDTDPIVYIENGKAYVKPNGGTVVKIAYPAVLNTDTAVTDFPDTMEHALVLYAVIQALNTKIRDEIANVSALTFTDPTVPTAPSAPSFTYTDASGSTVAVTESDIGLITAPTYTKPTLSLDAAPTAFSITATAPTPPSAPAYSYTDAVIGTYTATTIGSLGTAPTYTKPTTSATFTDLETYIGTDEDLEKASLEVQNQNARLQNYQMDLYNELNEFNKELEEYKSTVQKAIEQARLDQERLLTVGRDTTNLNIQNEIQTLNASIQLYQDTLGKYSQDINSYQAQVNSEVQEYAQNLQRWIAGRQTDLAKFASDIQNEVNEFNQEVEVYRQNINNTIANAQLLQQKLIDDAQRADNIDVVNKAKDLEKQISEYIQKLGLYQSEIASYSAQVNKEAQEYSIKVQAYANNVNLIKAQIEEVRAEYNSLLQAFVSS